MFNQNIRNQDMVNQSILSQDILNQKIITIIGEAFKLLNNQGDLLDGYALDVSIPKDDISKEIAKVTSLVIPDQVEPFEKSSSPLIQYVRSSTLHGNTETEPLLDLIKEVADYLPWKYNYEDRSDLGSYLGWAELIGPEAPFRTSEYCLGFTLISPNTLYPEHKHPATELYKVLSGTSDWTLEGVTTPRSPGDIILHPSNRVHKMETHEETLLALYTWTGNDVVTLSTYT